MTTQFKPKNKFQFPNQWALDSFLLKLKTSGAWTYKASMDGQKARLEPKGGAQGILIGLNKASNLLYADLNGEGLGETGDAWWKEIFEYSKRYGC